MRNAPRIIRPPSAPPSPDPVDAMVRAARRAGFSHVSECVPAAVALLVTAPIVGDAPEVEA